MNQRSVAAQDSSKRSLRLATAPVNWNNNDVPRWGSHTPFPDILDRMVEAGYTATEYDDAFGTNADTLVHEASSRGLTWCGCYQWVDFLDRINFDKATEELRPKLELLRAIDCQHLIVADSLRTHRVALAGRVPADGTASLTDAQARTMTDSVHRLADTAGEYGITVHFHNHVGTWIESPQEVEAFLRHLDASRVDLCFDTGHYAYGGGDAAKFISAHIADIGYLHVKDVDTNVLADAKERELTFIDALREIVFSPLGDGQADIPAILEVLVSGDFDGWVVVEQDTSSGDETATARGNLRYINDWLAGNAPSAAQRGTP